MKKTIILTVIYSLLILKSIYAQNYYKKDGKFGALTSDGSFLTEAKYDTIYDTGFIFKGKFLLSRILNKYGVIIFPSDTSPIIIEPKFDNVYLDNGIVILKIQNKYGFIGFDTKFESGNVFHWMKNVNISDVKYDNIIDGKLYIGNKVGLVYEGFYVPDRVILKKCVIIPAIYDNITIYNHSYASTTSSSSYFIIKVVNNGFVNYLSITNKKDIIFKRLFPDSTYTPAEISYIKDDHMFIINKLGKPLHLYQPEDSVYKTIKDEKGTPIIFDNYFEFSKKKFEVGDYVATYAYVGINDYEMIHIFAEQTKDNNIILFRDSITKDFRTINYKNINISKKNSYDSPVEYPITYIVKYSIYYSNDEKKTDIKLISYPNNKAFFSITINTENENLIFNKEEYYYEESCPYTKLYLEIKKGSKSKYKLLGYINYKTHEFMKNKPKDSGCKSQPLSWD